jgi:predicted nuclease of predicted toxin-antitoxin system
LRILFDKNVPYPLRRHLTEHHVRTAAEQGWSRLINGELLRVAERNGFEVLVTADQSLEYQQNLTGRKLALVVLSSNHIGILEKHPEKLVAAVEASSEGSYEYVKYDLPPKSGTMGRR